MEKIWVPKTAPWRPVTILKILDKESKLTTWDSSPKGKKVVSSANCYSSIDTLNTIKQNHQLDQFPINHPFHINHQSEKEQRSSLPTVKLMFALSLIMTDILPEDKPWSHLLHLLMTSIFCKILIKEAPVHMIISFLKIHADN